MSRKRSTAEQIIGLLREADVALSQGRSAGQVSPDRGLRNKRTTAGARNTVA
jgi:hypothetical protein